MIDEEIELLNKKLEMLDKNDFVYVWTEPEREAVKELIKEYSRLEEIEREHQKLIGELEEKLTKAEED